VRREFYRKNIEGTTHGKAERNREPAFLAKAENKEEKGADSKETSQRRGVAVEDFRNQIWSSDEEGEGNKSYDHLLGREITHPPNLSGEGSCWKERAEKGRA